MKKPQNKEMIDNDRRVLIGALFSTTILSTVPFFSIAHSSESIKNIIPGSLPTSGQKYNDTFNTLLDIVIANITIPVLLPSRKIGQLQILAATLEDKNGYKGFGYSYFVNNPKSLEKSTKAAIELASLSSGKLSQMANIERTEEAFYKENSDTHTKAAANALSLATWDLIGHQTGLSCSTLWQGTKKSIPCFRSGYYWNDQEKSAKERAREAYDANFRMVKVLVAQADPSTEIDRILQIQDIFRQPNTVIADAFWKWSPEEASKFAMGIKIPLLWFEDPTAYHQIGKVTSPHPIASGESISTINEFSDIAEQGARRIIIDLGKIGGPLRFLEAARLFNSLGIAVGSHVYPHQSVHILNSLLIPSPVEMLDWWNPLYTSNPQPDLDGLLEVNGPGFGLTPNYDFINRSNNRVFHRKL